MTAMHDNSYNDLNTIECNVEDERWHDVVSEQDFYHALRAIERALPTDHTLHVMAKPYEISLTLCDDPFIRSINQEWRDKDKATNVLSFPQFDDLLEETDMIPAGVNVPVGDIFIAYDTVKQESITQKKTFKDHALHMFIHGFLHLLGYDHIDNDEAEIMEALEITILGRINIANPYETMYTEL
jgi:probable rRNA maturation factor